MRELTLWSAHAAQHLIPVGLVALIGTIQLKSPQFHFFIDFVFILKANHIVVQQFLDLFLVILYVDDIYLQLVEFQSFVVDSVVERISEGGEVDVAVDDSGGFFAQVVILLE